MKYEYIEKLLREHKEWGLSVFDKVGEKGFYCAILPQKYISDLMLIFTGKLEGMEDFLLSEEGESLSIVVEHESIISGLEKLERKVKQWYKKENWIKETDESINFLIGLSKGIVIYEGEMRSINEG